MNSDIYNTDIEMIMDFMKLSLLFDDENVSDKDKMDILQLQKKIIDILPVSQSNKISAAHRILEEIYQINENELNDSKRREHCIILFYKSTCPACQRILGVWENFKRQNANSDFTIIDYDAMDPENTEIFKHFKIDSVPTIFKLKFDRKDHDFIEKLSVPITSGSLNDFARF